VLLPEFANDAAEAAALLPGVDLPRHADVVDRRHEHEEPPWHRRVGGEARALGAERLLGDLNDDLLPLFQELFDLRLGSLIAIAVAPAAMATLPWRPSTLAQGASSIVGRRSLITRRRKQVLVRLEAIELLERRDDVRDVEKAVAFETEINERRLHAGEHFRYPALVQIAHDAARAFPLDEDLGDLIVLEDRDPCLVGARGDDHLLGHARNSDRAGRRARNRSRLCAPAGPSAASRSAQSSSRPCEVAWVA
jgi:hypothetical protein